MLYAISTTEAIFFNQRGLGVSEADVSKVKSDAGDAAAGYLDDKVDNSTLEVDTTNNWLEVKGVDDAGASTYFGKNAASTVGWHALPSFTGSVVFSYGGCADSGSDYGMGSYPNGGAHADLGLVYWWSKRTSYDKVAIRGKFKKTSDVDTVTFYAWVANDDASTAVGVEVDIGGESGSVVTTATHSTNQWITADVDVSGLTDGQFYDVAVSVKTGSAAQKGRLYFITGISS